MENKDPQERIEDLEALGRLAGKLGHDFNNVLASIQGCAEILKIKLNRQFPEGNPYEKQFRIIESSLKRGVEISTKIRGYLRPGPLDTQPVELEPIVQSVAELLSKSGLMKDDVEVVVQSQPRVKVNEFFITQAILSICSNAIDAMANFSERTLLMFLGEEDVSANGPAGLNPGKYARISIIDHGIGMNDETKKRVFEPFFSTKPTGVGKGIGLDVVMADGILRRHGGGIRIDSGEGRGTAVHLYIPIV